MFRSAVNISHDALEQDKASGKGAWGGKRGKRGKPYAKGRRRENENGVAGGKEGGQEGGAKEGKKGEQAEACVQGEKGKRNDREREEKERGGMRMRHTHSVCNGSLLL